MKGEEKLIRQKEKSNAETNEVDQNDGINASRNLCWPTNKHGTMAMMAGQGRTWQGNPESLETACWERLRMALFPSD